MSARFTAARLAPLAVLALCAPLSARPLAAQSRWITTLSLGTSRRVPDVAAPFRARGGNWGGSVTSGVRLAGGLFATLHGNMMMQSLDLHDSAGAYAGTFSFHSYVLGAGPTVALRRDDGMVGLVSLHPAVVVSFWGPSEFGDCPRCGTLLPTADDRQTEARAAAAFSLQVGYQFVERGPGRRAYAVALEFKGLAAPRHTRSGIAVANLGVHLAFIAGEP